MSSLKKLLVPDVSRTKIKERGKPGQKTPLMMKTSLHQDLQEILVSDSQGNLSLRGNSPKGIPSAFFRLDVSEEDMYLFMIADKIYRMAGDRDWLNTTLLDTLSEEDLEDFLGMFHAYGIELKSVIAGALGHRMLYDAGVLKSPSTDKDLIFSEDHLNEESLLALQSEYFMSAMMLGRPVYYNKFLDPYLIFAADPTFVGTVTRLGDYASVLIHNPERGLILVRMNDYDLQEE